MLRRTSKIAQILAAGGPFVGDNKPTTRVAVIPNWYLNLSTGPVGNFTGDKLPVRWWNDAVNGPGTMIEIPNLKSCSIDRQLSQAADTIELDFYNTATPANGTAGPMPDAFGERGYLAPFYGSTAQAQQRWNQTPNSWANVLRENAMLFLFQGYGGWLNADGSVKTLDEAIADGSVMHTGVFLVDAVAIEAKSGIGKLTGRSMAKLLIEQSAWPPLVPSSFYTSAGIVYYHDQALVDLPVTVYGTDGSVPYPTSAPYAGGSNWISTGVTAPLEGTFKKAVYDMAIMPDNQGYRLLGSDGGVFVYGSAAFAGSEGSTKLNAKAVAIDNTTSGNGYWVTCADGGVFTFGDAVFYGGKAGQALNAPIMCMRRTPSGSGYWLCGQDGGIFTFGDASFYGSGPANYTLNGTVVGFAIRPQGDGYWMLTNVGSIYTFGNAAYYNDVAPGHSSALTDGGIPMAVESSGSGNGYRILTSTGGVFTFGDAQYHTLDGGTLGPATHPIVGLAQMELNAPASNIRRTPDDNGYYIVAEDGGVFTNGDSNFHGSLPGEWDFTVAGNYADWGDIVSDFLLWAGWYLHGSPNNPGQRPPVFGVIQYTGAYNVVGPVPPPDLDKLQIIDIIKKLKDIVGYIFRIREDGSAYFNSPHIWEMGNHYDDMTPAPDLPIIDERLNMTDYIQTTSDSTLRSEIIVAAEDPYVFGGTPTGATSPLVVTRFVPPNIQSLHGIVKPAMIGVPLNVPISQEDQDLLAELQALFCWLGLRTGQVSCVVDPAVCPDDQIRIFERSSGETSVHYVTGVHTEHDLQQGTWIATYTTQWMGDKDSWSIQSSLSGGVLNDQAFDSNGNLIFNDTYVISDTLAVALGNTGSTTTQVFRIANGFDDVTGSPTI